MEYNCPDIYNNGTKSIGFEDLTLRTDFLMKMA